MKRNQLELTLASGDYLPVVRDFALSRGIRPSDLLEGSELSAADFIQPPELVSNFIVNRVGQNLFAKLDDPIAEAVHYGLQVRPSSHGALGVAIQTSESLREGLTLLSKFYNTRLAAQYPEITIDEEFVSLSLITNPTGMGHSPDVQRFFDLSTFVSMAQSVGLSLADSCSLPGEVVIEIDADEPKNFPHQVLDYCKFTFKAKSLKLHFPSTWLDLPFESANKALCEAAIAQCEEELRKVKPQDLVDRIRTLISKNEGPLPGIDEIAEQNFMSVATLKRKLGELEYTYQGLKDEVRLGSAKSKLASTDLSVELIADQLGFSDSSNFTKFFKKHSGYTPKQYRSLEQ